MLGLSTENRFDRGGIGELPSERAAPEFQPAFAGVDAVGADADGNGPFAKELEGDALAFRGGVAVGGRTDDHGIAGLGVGLDPINKPLEHFFDAVGGQVVNADAGTTLCLKCWTA